MKPSVNTTERNGQAVPGAVRIVQEPVSYGEVREKLRAVLGLDSTSLDGGEIVDALRKCCIDIEETPRGQLILMDELTKLMGELGLSIALVRDLATWHLEIVTPRR